MGNTTSLLSNYHIKEQLASDGRGNLNFILFKASLKINPQSHVSLFEYVLKQSDAPSLAFIKNAASKFKSIRHPGIIKYLTSQVMDSTVLFVTDYCIPLNQTLSRLPQEQVYLGLYGILDALDFLHSQQMVLNFCDLSTIYVSAGTT